MITGLQSVFFFQGDHQSYIGSQNNKDKGKYRDLAHFLRKYFPTKQNFKQKIWVLNSFHFR